MHNLHLPTLAESIRQVFLSSDRYQMDKYISEFTTEGAYAGDCFNFNIFEPKGDEPPVFYHVYSPFDVISRHAPQRALIYQNGELLLDIDFTPYIPQRTGIMSPIVFQALGVQELQAPVLFLGTGRVARQALRALKAMYPDLTAVDYINTRGEDAEFGELGSSLGVTTKPTTLADLEHYGCIICHSSARQPILTKEHISQIRKGAIITTFASEDSYEVAEDLFDTANATVIVDWERTSAEAPELSRAIKAGTVDADKILYLKDILASPAPAEAKQYTIYRSYGTPMQNLAALKLLQSTNKEEQRAC